MAVLTGFNVFNKMAESLLHLVCTRFVPIVIQLFRPLLLIIKNYILKVLAHLFVQLIDGHYEPRLYEAKPIKEVFPIVGLPNNGLMHGSDQLEEHGGHVLLPVVELIVAKSVY